MKVSIDSTTNAVSISDSGILATPSYVTRTFDPRILVRMFCDFHNASSPFVEVVQSDGSIAYGNADTPANVIRGVSVLSTSQTVNGSSAAIRTHPSNYAIEPAAGVEVRFSANARLLFETPSQQTLMRSAVGFFATQGANPVRAICFRTGTFTGLTATNTWWCSTINTPDGGATTTTNFNTGISVETFRNLSIEINPNFSQVVFKIDGSTVYTSTTNIPSTSGVGLLGGAYVTNSSASAGNNKLLLDYMLLDQYVNR
jgi:hypothetical protein